MVSSNNFQVPRTHLTPTKLSKTFKHTYNKHFKTYSICNSHWNMLGWCGMVWRGQLLRLHIHATPHHTTPHQYNVLYYHTSIELLCKGNMRLFGKWMWNGNTTRLLTYDCATQALPKSPSLHEPEKSELMLSYWRVPPRRLDGWLAGIRGSHWGGGCWEGGFRCQMATCLPNQVFC